MFRDGEVDGRKIIGKCLVAFPYMWFYVSAAACQYCLLFADLADPACQGVSTAS